MRSKRARTFVMRLIKTWSSVCSGGHCPNAFVCGQPCDETRHISSPVALVRTRPASLVMLCPAKHTVCRYLDNSLLQPGALILMCIVQSMTISPANNCNLYPSVRPIGRTANVPYRACQLQNVITHQHRDISHSLWRIVWFLHRQNIKITNAVRLFMLY